jgi:DNA-binding MarR family transcriptional regulator
MEAAAADAATNPYPELTDAWEEFFASVRRARGRAARNDGELSLPQYHLLAALSDQGAARCGELAESAGVAASTASRMLDTLVREGLVDRCESPEDRRAVRIALTERGAAAHARKRAEVEEKLTRMFGSLEPDERESAERLLRRFAVLIDEL